MPLGFYFLKFFLCLSFFSFSYLLAAVIDLLQGLLAVQTILRKQHQDGQILPLSSLLYSQASLVWVFPPNFWAFLWTFQARLGRSLWSGYHWKDLFLFQKLSTDGANFGRRGWHQNWNKGQRLSQHVMASTGVTRLSSCEIKAWKKNSGLSGIQTHDFYDAGAEL